MARTPEETDRLYNELANKNPFRTIRVLIKLIRTGELTLAPASQSSELSKREKEVERLNNYLSEANKENAKLGASLTEREQEVERLKDVAASAEKLINAVNIGFAELRNNPSVKALQPVFSEETQKAILISLAEYNGLRNDYEQAKIEEGIITKSKPTE